MSPPIPVAGLNHVLRAWSGRGQLLEAMAAVVATDPIQRAWTARDIRRRTNRVLFAQVANDVARLPNTSRRWQQALPAESTVDRVLATTPRAGFDVVRTRLRGWPPDGFVVRQRERVAEELLARTTRWTLGRLIDVAKDAAGVEPSIIEPVQLQVDAAVRAIQIPPLADATPQTPDRGSLLAVRRAGPPWSTIAALASMIRAAERDVESFVGRLVEPDADLRWRLFHLSVLGEVLLTLIDAGHTVVSLRPLSASSVGANYRSWRSDRNAVEVWFEAAGIWRSSGLPSPYVAATAGLREAGSRPLGPDILLLSANKALVIECKYSASAAYVATGYEQVVAYAAELSGSVADSVDAVVVGPDGTVDSPTTGTVSTGPVSVVPTSSIRQVVTGWLR